MVQSGLFIAIDCISFDKGLVIYFNEILEVFMALVTVGIPLNISSIRGSGKKRR